MGLSRNKVAVSEGAAGSPPFYGERDLSPKDLDRRRDFDSSNFVVQFSVTEGKNSDAEEVSLNSWCH